MKDWPWWLLLINGLLLLPTLCCPLFLFGGLHAFAAHSGAMRVLNYVAVQAAWVAPLVLAVLSLDLYRRGWHARAVALSAVGLLFVAAYGYHLYTGIRFAY